MSSVAQPHKRRRRRFSKDDLELTVLSLPTVLWYLAFCYLPMFGVILAFKRYRPLGENFIDSLMKSDWAGWANFKFLFATSDATTIIRNTLLYNAAFIVLGIIASVTLAIILSQLHSKRIQKFTQTAMFLPHFLSWVVVCYFVYAFLSPRTGLLANALRSAQGVTPDFYNMPGAWPVILVIVNLWKTTGYSMVVYLAAIAGIDESYYEAALIDGAGKWQQCKYITLPQLRPIITILFILAVGRIFNSDFGLFYQVPRDVGALFDTTATIDTYVYKVAFARNANVGRGAAAALLQSVVGLVMILTANWVVTKVDPDSSLF